MSRNLINALGRRSIDRDAMALNPILRHQLMKPVFNVRDTLYGATGDGTTDDATAFQDAIDAANTAGGGIVYVPPNATYIIGTQLNLGSDAWLMGGGWSTILKEKDSADLTAIIAADTKSNIHISDLQLDGNKANQTVNLLHGIRLDDCTDITIERILSHSFKGTTGAGNEGAGILIRGDAAFEARASIGHCITHSIGGYGIGTYRAGRVMIHSCLSYDNDSMGFSLSGSTTSDRDNSIVNCAAWDNGQAGFNLENQIDAAVTGCISHGHNVTGLGGYRIQNGARIVIADSISASDEKGVVTTGTTADEPNGVLLSDLFIDTPDGIGIDLDATASSDNWMKVDGCRVAGGTQGINVSADIGRITISNCQISACANNGINSLHADRGVFSGNLCDNNTSSGIRVSTSTGTAVITGNECWGNDVNGIQLVSIADERGAVVSGNHCYNNSQNNTNTYDGILIQGCNAVAVTGNSSCDDQTTPTQRYGIAEGGTCDYNAYVGNVCRGNSTGAILESGSNNKQGHNIGSATHDT